HVGLDADVAGEGNERRTTDGGIPGACSLLSLEQVALVHDASEHGEQPVTLPSADGALCTPYSLRRLGDCQEVLRHRCSPCSCCRCLGLVSSSGRPRASRARGRPTLGPWMAIVRCGGP